jgi:serine/threonine-protein kinase
MSLVAGTRLGPYEIQSAIGAGGMGEVYKARDTRLDRTVAIKVLPAEISGDPDRRARFEREARTIASLNHPHICTLHDVGEHGDSTYLVMEHLAGETLAERMQKGRLPPDQALTVATEIADALKAAHRQGIIHRDLKPGNVMLTKAGAKLLDFGLAKLAGHGAAPAGAQLGSAATRSAPLTAEGTIVGTLQYMAPEQVEGKPADARTDLWALGAILYEMLTGKRAFEGTSAASLIGNIMNAEPASLSTLQPLTPAAVDRLVRQCLAKAPEDRPDTAHDVANELRWIRESSGLAALTHVRPRRGRWRALGRTGLVGLAGALVGVASMWVFRPTGVVSRDVVRSSLDVRPADAVTAGYVSTWNPTAGGSRTALAWTPDGRAIVFVGLRRNAGAASSAQTANTRGQLYIRQLDREEAQPIPGTEGATAPVVSADGQAVAFYANGAIRHVRLAGGPITTLAEPVPVPPARISWTRAGGVIFDAPTQGGLWQCDGRSVPTPVTTIKEPEIEHVLPELVDNDRVLLYTARRSRTVWGDEEVVAQVLATNERSVILRKATDARYLPTGHLVFMRQGVLWAVRFDPSRRAVQGEPVALHEGIAQALVGDNEKDITGAGQFSVSPAGTLAYISGEVPTYPGFALVSVDRAGHVTEIPTPHRFFMYVRGSRDGAFLTTDAWSTTEHSLWRHTLSRPGSFEKLLSGVDDTFAWTPDGRRVAYGTTRNNLRLVEWQATDGTPPETLVRGSLKPISWAPDGQHLFLADAGDRQVWVLSVDGPEPRLRQFTEGSDQERYPEISPDGRWLAYGSTASGRWEVYVRPFPGPGPRTQVTLNGGLNPGWNPDGRELFFATPPNSASTPTAWFMNVVDLDVTRGVRVGAPRRLFEFNPDDLAFNCLPMRCYDVAPDGQRFYVPKAAAPVPPPPVVTHINLIQNWFEELKAKVPAGGVK